MTSIVETTPPRGVSARLRSYRQVAAVERRLLGLLRPYRWLVAQGVLVTVVITAVGLAKP